MDMCASDCALTVRDRHNVLGGIGVGVWVKGWLPCGGRGIPVSCCVNSEVDGHYVRFYEEVEQQKDLLTLFWRFDGQPLAEAGL